MFSQNNNESGYGFSSKIDKKSFITKSKNLPEILDFFGLFDFLYKIMYAFLNLDTQSFMN